MGPRYARTPEHNSTRACPHYSVPLSLKRCKETYPTPGTETIASPMPHAPLPASLPPTIHPLTCLRPSYPQGSAPVIQDGAVTLAESNAIVKYILTRYGRDQLQVAPDAPNYADYLYWLYFGNGTTLPGISRNMTFSFTGLPPSHLIGVRLEAMAQKPLQLLEDRVAQSTWLAGEEFTAADLLNVFGVTTMLFWSFGLEKYRAILAWLKRVGEREAYRTAVEKGDPGFTPLLGVGAPEVLWRCRSGR